MPIMVWPSLYQGIIIVLIVGKLSCKQNSCSLCGNMCLSHRCVSIRCGAHRAGVGGAVLRLRPWRLRGRRPGAQRRNQSAGCWGWRGTLIKRDGERADQREQQYDHLSSAFIISRTTNRSMSDRNDKRAESNQHLTLIQICIIGM